MNLNEKLLNTIFWYDSNSPDIKAVEKLILDGADVNYVDYYSKHSTYSESLLAMAITCINADDGKISDYYREVVELLLANGARVDLIGSCDADEYSKPNSCIHHLSNECKHTPLDLLILQSAEDGINQSSYSLAKMMITSLNDKELVKYFRDYGKPKTKKGLIKILIEFNRYDLLEKYPEYLI